MRHFIYYLLIGVFSYISCSSGVLYAQSENFEMYQATDSDGLSYLYTIVGNGGIYNRYDIIDTALIHVKYKTRYCIDTISGRYIEEMSMLEIGYNLSKFQHFKNFVKDSLSYRKDNSWKHDIVAGAPYPLSLFEIIYIDKNSREVTTTNSIYIQNISYEEKYIEPIWKMDFSETTQILGYTCYKATCDYYGRTYTAWFTTEISSDRGPWKLSGLPGLIVKAEDAKGHYSFEAVGIYQTVEPMLRMDLSYLNATRKQYFNAKKLFITNPTRAKELYFLNKTSGVISSGIKHDIREMHYSFIEL